MSNLEETMNFIHAYYLSNQIYLHLSIKSGNVTKINQQVPNVFWLVTLNKQLITSFLMTPFERYEAYKY